MLKLCYVCVNKDSKEIEFNQVFLKHGLSYLPWVSFCHSLNLKKKMLKSAN